MQLHADKTSLRKQAKAAPAPQRQHPEALSVTNSYIVDTGCGKDLISKEMVVKWSAHICQTTPLELHTAGGLTHTTKALRMTVQAFMNEPISAYIMDKTLPVLSVGKRVRIKIFS